MSEPNDEREASAPLDQAWLTVLDGLIGGIHHALNNRSAALAAVAQVLDGEIPAGSPLGGIFTQEMERLRTTVGLLSHLPRGRSARPEPLQLSDLTPELQGLFGLHHDLRDTALIVEIAPGVLPVWADQAELMHVLMILLAAAGAEAWGREDAAVRLDVTGDAERVRIRVSVEGGAANEDDADGREAERGGGGRLTGVGGEAVEEWLAAAGGALTIEGGADGVRGYLAELPTLLAVRRDERG